MPGHAEWLYRLGAVQAGCVSRNLTLELGTSIRDWLGLPPGPWPPDHYALLGLEPGAGDFAAIEARVLDRMERLRTYQLRHPEAVTEGMNRLAQALVCLTDPVARAAYDRQLGIAPAPFEVVEDELPEPPAEVTPVPGARQQNLPYEVVEPADEQPYEVLADASDELPYALDELPAFEVVPDLATRAPQRPRKAPKLKRRTIYRRLAALRRATRAWEALRPVLGTPGEPLATPVSVFTFLRALADARAALPGAAFAFEGARPPGSTVLALVRLPSVLSTVRGLLLSQRKAVARDWHHGHALLRREYAALRQLVRRTHRARRTGAELARLVRRTPELVLALLAALLVLGSALVRNR